MLLPFQFDDIIFWCVAAGIVGLCVGSFLNVVIYRLPVMMKRAWAADVESYLAEERDKENPRENAPDAPDAPDVQTTQTAAEKTPRFNLVVPRSACPHCGHKITALENIPVVSWLFLRGRCSACRARIALRYPLVELVGGVLAVLAAWQFGETYQAVAACVFLWALLALALIDLDTYLLPDDITFPLLWAGLIVNYFGWFTTLPDAVWGAVIGYLSLWAVYWAFRLIAKKEGMGYGDFKLLAAMGAWLGVKSLLIIVLFSSLAGAVIGLALIARGRHRDNPIPFGPYLAIAGAMALFVGEPILKWLHFQ